jgi:N-acetylmuramoyl-L-alanine amidase
MSKVIYLSPSTQENNVGAGNYGTEEKRMNQVADVVERVLLNHGLVVYRNKPEWTLQKVVQDSNSKKPDIHFAIHSNAGGGRGGEVFAFAPGGEGEKAAKAIYSELEPLTPTSDRGVKFNPKLYELNSTNASAVLVEIAFHDSSEDAKWIIDNIEGIGIALAKGVLKYLGIAYREPSKPEVQPSNDQKLYRVMSGSYSIRENAEKQVQKLKTAGFDAVIMIFNK